ncbi:hypothetical protein Q3A66_19130 [Hymenobacter sp. BT770]|uniref:hypothetical protein n=1 Tax=Hymenobacter sp. BT770 TaxID=2886942 RepID=UPI001D0FE002|nr:hypothetical protein [Hymenobacter sp. BT770]MCC3155232.1 hypothetical protein [Hymenobacter sp. BT770]MDO3417187.1 hypothetical protein [Hymenobacter sp. BT770]
MLPRLLPVRDQSRDYLLAQQQTLYKKLLAGRKRVQERKTSALSVAGLSLADITRDLAGWTTPQAGALRKAQPHAAPRHGKRATDKSRHN